MTATIAQRDEVMEQRDEILAEIEGRTLLDVFMATCDAHGGRAALVVDEEGVFVERTWSQYREQASSIAAGLISLGVTPGDHVALMMPNRPEHVVCDVAAMLAGATPVSIYNTLTADQIAHIAADCHARIVIVNDAELLDKWLQIGDRLPALERIVVVETDGVDLDDARIISLEALEEQGGEALRARPELLESTWRAVGPDDAATLIYTSGTTGPPKGVVLSHRNVLYQLGVVERLLDVQPGQRGLSYLPLAHIAERVVTHYVGLHCGGTIYFVPELPAVVATLQEARPQMFMAVPRVWEKMHAAIMARIEENPRKAPIAHRAIAVGRKAVEEELAGRTPSLRLRTQRALFDRLVFSKIRHGLGMDELRYAISGAAPISAELLTFFKAIGVEIIEVYGMTETTAVVTANRPGQVRIGTVGPALPGIEVRIADDGEILARGPSITSGYLNADEATAELIDDDGWLHTGDLGTIDDDGYLTVVGRKKELIITAGGKNVSPSNVEEAIKQRSPLISQVCAVGDDRPFIAAILVLDAEVLPIWCATQGVDIDSPEDAVGHPDVLAEVRRAVEAGNEKLSRVEQVKQWTLVADQWSVETEELTPSLKLKRGVVLRKYADTIEGLYTADA